MPVERLRGRESSRVCAAGKHLCVGFAGQTWTSVVCTTANSIFSVVLSCSLLQSRYHLFLCVCSLLWIYICAWLTDGWVRLKVVRVTWLRVAEYSGLTGRKGTALRSVTSVLWFWVVSHTERNRKSHLANMMIHNKNITTLMSLSFTPLYRLVFHLKRSQTICSLSVVHGPTVPLTNRASVWHPSMLPLLPLWPRTRKQREEERIPAALPRSLSPSLLHKLPAKVLLQSVFIQHWSLSPETQLQLSPRLRIVP